MIIVAFTIPVKPISDITFQLHRWFSIRLIRIDVVEAVREIIWIAATISIYSHRSVALVIVHGKWATVHRYLFKVGAQTITVCIRICKYSSLQHFVRRITNTVNDMCRCKGGLLYMCMIVIRVYI